MASTKPHFSLASPDDKTQIQHEDTHEDDSQKDINRLSNDDTTSPQEIPQNDPTQDSPNSDLSFTKKDIRKSRTQSFQSVLSTASLKSLKSLKAPLPRNNLIISNSGKNFQSFIQAPALSSINPKSTVEIGKHVPFNSSSNTEGITTNTNAFANANGNTGNTKGITSNDATHTNPGSTNPGSTNPGSTNSHPIIKSDVITHNEVTSPDEDPLNLTLDALKRLSKSPLPIVNEPYKPAKVDLSQFASLTRQSKLSQNLPEVKEKPEVKAQSVASNYKLSIKEETVDEKDEPILNNLKLNLDKLKMKPPKVPAAVTPPTDMIRRSSSQNVNNEGNQNSFNQNNQNNSSPSHSPNAPNGFKSTKQVQQIKGLRSPMYIPAVLRVTQSNIEHDSPFDHLQKSHANSSRNSVASQDSQESIKPASIKSSRNYEEILRAPPTRKHWLKDELVLKCCLPVCTKVFNFFERRHHCRKCGKIYCKEHTSHYLYINHLAQFTTGGRGTLCKVCDSCIEDYNEFIKLEFGISKEIKANDKTPSLSSSKVINYNPNKSNLKSTYSSIQRNNNNQNQINPNESNDNNTNSRADQLVGSVPANWSWSSF